MYQSWKRKTYEPDICGFDGENSLFDENTKSLLLWNMDNLSFATPTCTFRRLSWTKFEVNDWWIPIAQTLRARDCHLHAGADAALALPQSDVSCWSLIFSCWSLNFSSWTLMASKGLLCVAVQFRIAILVCNLRLWFLVTRVYPVGLQFRCRYSSTYSDVPFPWSISRIDDRDTESLTQVPRTRFIIVWELLWFFGPRKWPKNRSEFGGCRMMRRKYSARKGCSKKNREVPLYECIFWAQKWRRHRQREISVTCSHHFLLRVHVSHSSLCSALAPPPPFRPSDCEW